MSALNGLRIGVVGAGNIGRILLTRLRSVGVEAERLLVFDTDDGRAACAAAAMGARLVESALVAELWESELLLLAAPPPAILGILGGAAPRLRQGQTVISFAAGVRLEWLEAAVPAGVEVARVMPNAPSAVGRGFNPFCWGARLSASGRARVRAVLDALGESVEVPEPQLSWWVGLSGAAMRSLLPVLEGMVEAGLEAGLEPAVARLVAIRLFQGTAALVETDTRPLKELKRLTPMETLDDPTVRALFLAAARGARARAVELEGKLEMDVTA